MSGFAGSAPTYPIHANIHPSVFLNTKQIPAATCMFLLIPPVFHKKVIVFSQITTVFSFAISSVGFHLITG